MVSKFRPRDPSFAHATCGRPSTEGRPLSISGRGRDRLNPLRRLVELDAWSCVGIRCPGPMPTRSHCRTRIRPIHSGHCAHGRRQRTGSRNSSGPGSRYRRRSRQGCSYRSERPSPPTSARRRRAGSGTQPRVHRGDPRRQRRQVSEAAPSSGLRRVRAGAGHHYPVFAVPPSQVAGCRGRVRVGDSMSSAASAGMLT